MQPQKFPQIFFSDVERKRLLHVPKPIARERLPVFLVPINLDDALGERLSIIGSHDLAAADGSHPSIESPCVPL